MSGKVKINLVTMTREDLFDVAHVLSEVLRAALQKDDSGTYVMSLRGSYQSGKSILADVVRDDIWGKEAACETFGSSETDEYWVREQDGRKIEYDYIDIARVYGFARTVLNGSDYASRENNFLAQRRHPGITVIQNKKNGRHVDIDVHVQSPEGQIVRHELFGAGSFFHDGEGFSALKHKWQSGLRRVFNKAATLHRGWTRLVEISIDAGLLENAPGVKEAVDRLSVQAAEVKKMLKKVNKNDYDKQFSKPLLSRKYQMKGLG